MVEDKGPTPPASPPESPKLIEIPLSKEVMPSKQVSAARSQPPTVFVLKDGEQLESRFYLLTASSLQIEVGRQRRTIPVSTLAINATIAANRERGIELSIPRDRNTVFLGF